MPRLNSRAALCCLLLSPLLAMAQAPLKAALFEVAPYAQKEGGAPSGLYVDWVKGLGTRANLRTEIALMPFARVPLALQRGEADVTISFSTPALDASAQALGTVALVDSVLITSADRSTRELSQLKGALVGRARGGCQDLAQRSELQLRWTEISNFESALRMLALGRMDGVCLTRDVLRYYSALASIERSRLGAEILVGQRPALLYVRRGLAPAVVAQLQAALAQRPPVRVD